MIERRACVKNAQLPYKTDKELKEMKRREHLFWWRCKASSMKDILQVEHRD